MVSGILDKLTCDPSQFRCVESGRCIRGRYRCDERADCLDRSDETGCNTTGTWSFKYSELKHDIWERQTETGSEHLTCQDDDVFPRFLN